jgi:pilus assembly protein Flp/PilA
MNFLKHFYSDEQGQGMVEYGLVVALIALAVIAALTLFGGNIATSYGAIDTKATGAMTPK